MIFDYCFLWLKPQETIIKDHQDLFQAFGVTTALFGFDMQNGYFGRNVKADGDEAGSDAGGYKHIDIPVADVSGGVFLFVGGWHNRSAD